MSWAKIHHGTLDKLAMLGLSRGVRLLHIEAMEWSDRNLKDGEIPTGMLVRFTDEPDPIAAAAQLAAAGLWTETATGWEIVNYLKQQSSAAYIELSVERNRKFQETRRKCLKDNHEDCGGPRSKCQKKVTTASNNGAAAKVPAAPVVDPLDDLVRQLTGEES